MLLTDLTQPLRLGLPAGLTFSPADLAQVGAKPCLTDYRNRLRRFLDQADVQDGLLAGIPTPLAQENGKIKEIVSILFACSSSGPLVHGPRNRCRGALPTAVAGRLDTL
jgi:hypothetical protein